MCEYIKTDARIRTHDLDVTYLFVVPISEGGRLLNGPLDGDLVLGGSRVSGLQELLVGGLVLGRGRLDGTIEVDGGLIEVGLDLLLVDLNAVFRKNYGAHILES